MMTEHGFLHTEYVCRDITDHQIRSELTVASRLRECFSHIEERKIEMDEAEREEVLWEGVDVSSVKVRSAS